MPLPQTIRDAVLLRARDLSGQDDLLFRRNGVTGALEVVDRGGAGRSWTGLNTELHANV